jgi:proteasome lid subunit RPN8/RPN11
MLQALVKSARELFSEFHGSWGRAAPVAIRQESAVAVVTNYLPLQRVLLTDEVARTLFEEYAAHRKAERGDEETGWVLLGHREAKEAIVLATLPAGSLSDAGVAHIRFNSTGQALASRIVRQHDKRLAILGVVHTHPGSLRHPSDGDLRGDREWVRKLRRSEGVFGIGTADGAPIGGSASGSSFAYQPRPHVQCLGELRFSWYALQHGDSNYRPLPAELTIGPDVARPLHAIWPIVEEHAERLERLYLQQANVRFEVLAEPGRQGLLVTLPLATKGAALHVLLSRKEVRYYLQHGGELRALDYTDECVDRGVYLALAELASQA